MSMEFLSGYLLSVVGVVLLIVLIDLILPEGKISKYIKSIVSIVVVAVIVSPVAKLVNTDFDFKKLFDGGYQVDTEFLNEIDNQNIEVLCRDLEVKLSDLGYVGTQVSIVTGKSENVTIIKYIYVNLCDLVINKNEAHIDYYTKIKESVTKLVSNIKEEQVVVYG